LFKNKILTNPDLLKLGSDMKTILKNSIIESRVTKKILATKAQRHKETQRNATKTPRHEETQR